MQLLHFWARRGGVTRRIAALAPCIVASLFVAVLAVHETAAQIIRRAPVLQPRGDKSRPEDQEIVAGVYLPTDRSLSRAIARAKERLAEHEYHEALAFLHTILGRDEDSFLERSGDDRGQLGLKATARKLIGELPPEGHDAYELLNGPTARRQLEAALKSGDRNGLAKVVRQFFHTSAGYEATLVLAQMEADQGHRLAAAQLYQELIDTPRAAARFEPQLSVAAALNQLAAGRSEESAATIRSLLEHKPSPEIMLSGKAATLPAPGADPLVWLAAFAGQASTSTNSQSNWLTLHGDPSRNVLSPGGKPHLRARWEARVVNEPAIESYLLGRANDFVQRNVVAIPGAHPIAVGDVVVMRTPDNVVAVDWQTGKRIWETRDEQELDTNDAQSDLAPGFDQDQRPPQGKPLEDRVWDDALATSLSSDGVRVFVVRGLSAPHDDDSIAWQIQPGFGRMGAEIATITNQLAAYDLATQGKLAWELDGSRTSGTLAGAFFLGPPLAIDNTLYVMAEVRSALYLLALDPATGHIEWQQQLIGLEQGISLDPARRRVGSTPSYAGGILVCPTSASAVVAIDVVKREFAWVYRYPREAQSPADARNLWQQQMQGQLVRANDHWLDSSAIVAENCVLITPAESAEIHCLDLHSGKQLWKRRQGDARFIGGVDHGVVLLVGSQAIQALRLSDGAPAWKHESVSLPSAALPAGQGYLSQGQYYLPLTSGQIAQIEMSSGNVTPVDAASPGLSLGNLICYRGSVLSQSPLVLDKFEQLDLLQKRTEAALAQNPADANALRDFAEIKGAAGDKPEAVKLLKRALELAPNDAVSQEMLVEVLLHELSIDYAAYRADVPLVAGLIRNRDQQIELLQIDAAGLDTTGERLAAWDAYLQLADFTADEPAYLRVDDRYTVRSDRWISSRLGAMWSKASDDERKSMSAKLVARRPTTDRPLAAGELRHYLAHLGELPAANDVRLALARFLVERDRPQEAELELLQLMAAPSPNETRAAAVELLANLDAKTSQRNTASHFDWPRGHVNAELVATTAASQKSERAAHSPGERQTGYRPLRVEQDFWPGGPATHWFVATDCSEIVGRNTLGDDVFHRTIDQSNRLKQFHDSGLVHGARMGQLLFVSLGGEVVALDSRQDSLAADGELLWPSRAADEFSADSVRPGRGLTPGKNRTGRPPVYHGASGRKRIAGAAGNAFASLGPVTPHGVVLQDQDELKCVEPLSGVLLWSRSDVPAGCELFGDGELVFAADVGNHIAYVVRVNDGQLLDKRELPKAEWLLTSGRNIAQLGFSMSDGNRVTLLTVTDIWSKKTVYRGEFPVAARVSVSEPNAVAVFAPTGEFHLIDVQTGRTIIDQKLQAMKDLQSIQLLRTNDELFLYISGEVQPQFKPIGLALDSPVINGPVYAFSLKTGEPLWPGPAVVRNRGAILAQPRDVPLLVFSDRQTIRDATNGGGSKLRVLCLDKRTGQTVYRNDSLPDTSTTRFRIRGENDSRPTVALEMSAGKILLAMTDRPRPPQPPANDDLEAPREIVERGLRGLGQRMGSALRGALERPSQALPPGPQPNPANPQKAPPPAQDNAQETDDD